MNDKSSYSIPRDKISVEAQLLIDEDGKEAIRQENNEAHENNNRKRKDLPHQSKFGKSVLDRKLDRLPVLLFNSLNYSNEF